MSKILIDEDTVKLALEALELHATQYPHMQKGYTVDAISALRERLAQPEQEPFCYHDGRNIVGKEYADHSDVFPLYAEPYQRKPEPLEAAVGTAYKTGWEHGKAVEREACAKLCESYRDEWLKGLGRYEFMGEGADFLADFIRARGQS